MSDVVRYRMIDGPYGPFMAKVKEGDWVRYDDYAALQARVAELEDTLSLRTNLHGEATHLIKELEARAEAAETRMAELGAALPTLLRELIKEQSEGEWDDATIEKDVAKFTKAIRALVDDPETIARIVAQVKEGRG